MMSSSQLNIAFVGRGTLSDNATTIRALGLGKELTIHGHRVSLFLPNLERNRELQAADRSGIEICLTGSREMEFVPKLFAMLGRSFDVVHCLNVGLNSYMTGWTYSLLRRRSVVVLDADEDMPMLVESGTHRNIVKAIEKHALRTADIVLCASSFLAERFRRRTSAPVEYLPYAVDPAPFTPYWSGPSGASKSAGKPIHALYMGTFQPHFNLPLLIHGIARAIQAIPDLHLIMVGDGPERLSLQRLANEVIPGRVTFPGFVPDSAVPGLLGSADMLVLPIEDTELNRSRCPNKIFQYMAARRPIITNRVGEVAAALGSEAHYFVYGSEEDFSRALGEAVSSPRVVSAEALKMNSWKHRTEQYLRYLRQVL